ncbi:MAG: hypothetical protein JSW61_06000 [Candidatus Thorarchaeota archaeon]|nr:MAG: hypothetical protein JSW61_06000 [Candidatus Thorarchaeota archaeon]
MNSVDTNGTGTVTRDKNTENSTAVVIVIMIIALNAIGDLIPGEEMGPARFAVSIVLAVIAMSIIWYLGRQLRKAVVPSQAS